MPLADPARSSGRRYRFIGGTAAACGVVLLAASYPVVAQAATVRPTNTAHVVATSPLRISTSRLPLASTGVAYDVQLSASGGRGPYSWLLTGGALPAGVELSPNGQISGTPSVAGSYSFRLRASDSSVPVKTASGSLTLHVRLTPVSITSPNLAGGTIGSPYTDTLTATGGHAPYTWGLASGQLQAGLTLSNTGVISGTPTQSGTSVVRLRVTDSSTQPRSATRGYRLVITPLPLTVGTTGLPAATVNSPYAASLTAAGGTAPYVWQMVGGHLPRGMRLSSSGTVAGITAAAGTYEFYVRARDQAGQYSPKTGLLLLVGQGATTWSGYVKSGRFSSVTGTFTVPTSLSCGQGNQVPSAVSEWVGLDGSNKTRLIKAGVSEYYGPPATTTGSGSTTTTAAPATCQGESVTIHAWWQALPAPPTPVIMTITAGDKITVTIFKVTRDKWALTLEDNTSGQTYRSVATYSGPGDTADYIVEAPSGLPLGAYSPNIEFSNLQTTGRSGPLGAVVLVESGVQVSTPSKLFSNSFAVGYGSIAPPPPGAASA
ncbi:MAG TPA: G1 family glutamic endopeptidase [Acidimicrobiales bacterium]|nr:G1 family glutamic endopeptidase [Acidimicrobiales bacterium]